MMIYLCCFTGVHLPEATFVPISFPISGFSHDFCTGDFTCGSPRGVQRQHGLQEQSAALRTEGLEPGKAGKGRRFQRPAMFVWLEMSSWGNMKHP